MKLNRLDEAGQHLDRAVELVPTARAVYYERAKLTRSYADTTRRMQDAEKALELKDPEA